MTYEFYDYKMNDITAKAETIMIELKELFEEVRTERANILERWDENLEQLAIYEHQFDIEETEEVDDMLDKLYQENHDVAKEHDDIEQTYIELERRINILQKLTEDAEYWG